MAYTRHTWQDNELITSDGLNNIEEGILISGKVLNVKDFGALGDNVNDDSVAINSVFLKASNDGMRNVYIPEGTYLVKNDIDFQSNINVFMHPKAIIYGPGMYYRFRSFGKGYGNGVSNVTVTGGCFSGDFDSDITYGHTSSNAMVGVFHHCENITFKNVKFNMTTSDSHSFDLGGCRNITIDNCEFYGLKPSNTSREYVEAIQVDYSNASGLTDKSQSELENVDGLPTYNVSVTNSKFLAIYNDDGSIKYYAPNPIGEHASYSEGLVHDVLFENNTVIDAMPVSTGGNISGWIHFYGVKNLTVKGNTFKNTKSYAANLFTIKCYTVAQLGKASPDSPDNVLYDTHENITFENNTITGFNSSTNVNGIITISGHTNNLYYAKNVLINRNNITDSFPVTADKNNPSIANGTDFINFNGVDDITITNNLFNSGRRFVSSQWGNLSKKDVTVSISNNLLTNVYYIPISIAGMNKLGNVIVSENEVINTNGFLNIDNVFFGRIVNNHIKHRDDGVIIAGKGFAGVSSQITNSPNIIFQNNSILQSSNSSYQYPKAIISTNSTILLSDGNYFNGTLQ